MGTVFFERAVKPAFMGQETDTERVEKAITQELPPVFDYLEGEIGDREVLVGGHFSIADIAAGSPFVNLMHGGETVDGSRWPRLAAYLERIHARPSFKALIEEEKATAAQMARG